ncbi:hypothetical protein C8R45DRAFT_958371 [Mycena sanguinolenta]|nr:hypothetical protein C8R45DRAFT_958371 [Mycena sanguinolenta]
MNKLWKKKWKDQVKPSDGDESLGGSGSVPRASLRASSSEPAPPIDFKPTVLHSRAKRSQTEASLDSILIPPLKKIKANALDGGLKSSIIVEADGASCCLNEVVLVYDNIHGPSETQLFHRILSLDTIESIFRPEFNAARQVAAEVGTCAADLVWRRALKNIDADVSLYSEEEEDDGPADRLNRTKTKVRETIKNWAFTMPNLDPNSRGFNVTPKFLQLVQILRSCEPYHEDFRGIVFVKRRATALALADLIPLLGEHVTFIRAHAFTRQGALLVDDQQQQDVFRKFTLGIYNLLIATNSVEDLDVPQATIVIRFDIFESNVSYAFQRSLATGHLVHMVERGNDDHRHNMVSSSILQPEMIRWTNILRCCPTSAAPPLPLPPRRYSEHSDSEEESEDFIQDPVAGGRIYPQDATTVVYRLASIATTKPFPSPLFDFQTRGSASSAASVYTCTVVAPGTPAHDVSGQPCSSMAQARRSACYHVCVKLAESGFLDANAFVFRCSREKTANTVDNASKLDDVPYGVQVYQRQTPLFWSHPTGPVAALFPTIITVDHSNQPLHAPILFLTRRPLPEFPSFKVFSSGTPITVQTYKGTPFSVDDGKLLSLQIYTLRLCRAIANKPFSCSCEDMAYFLSPVSSSWIPPSNPGSWHRSDVANYIPWDAIARGALSWAVPLKYGQPEDVAEDIKDAVIQDRSAELTRRYDVLRVRPDLSPLSHPEDSPREAGYSNLLEYCKAARKNFEGLKDEGQALIEVSSVMTAGGLDPAFQPPVIEPPPPRYLIPELCFKFTVPARTFRTALLLPSITQRLDSFLLVKELNARFFDHQISETLLDMAITAPSTRMEYDYERLELLGDAFLKYLASIYVFVTEPSDKEGALHAARQQIINNHALFQSFDSAGLPPYVQSRPFSPKSWQPPNFKTTEESAAKVDSNRQRKKNEQRLGDKVSADVAEAILAAAYLSGGSDAALMAAKTMNIPFPKATKWSDFGHKLLIPPSTISAKLKPETLQAVETIINHKFKHPHILAQALTHASMSGYERVSYERLEFIGDAILEFLVLRHVFERNPNLAPGGLTLLKGAMVSNSALGAVCVSSGLHNHVLLATRLQGSVADYIVKLKIKRTEEYELARAEKRCPGQYWQEVDPPKVLSDVVESVIGAIYVSDNCTPVGVEAFFDSVLKPFYDQHISLRTLAQHPTKILFELIQAQQCQKFQFLKEKASGTTFCHGACICLPCLQALSADLLSFGARRHFGQRRGPFDLAGS